MKNPFSAWVSDRPVFIVWRGSDKSPIDPLHADPASGDACSNAQNPQTWLSWDVAAEYARALGAGYGVGIVIQPPLLCVDIDGCISDGVLSPFANTLITDAMRCCPDVYVEVSMSGTGIHIIGPYEGVAPLHSTKNHERHCELYTRARYIALTGNMVGTRGASGGTLTDFLLSVAWTYFRPSAGSETPASWTTEYDPACTFTGTAAERVSALLKIKSFAAKFSPGKVTFADLHNVNVAKLAAVWPASPNSSAPYDASSVDQAYFNHLAYGFGNNCEAILEYLTGGACPLHRAKWDERPDYLRSTILKAVALPKQWRVQPMPVPAAPIAPPPPANTTVPPPPTAMPTLEETALSLNFIGASHMAVLFNGYTYVNDMHRIVAPDGFIMDKAKFDAHPRFAKRAYLMTYAEQKTTPSAWDAFLQSEVSTGRKVRGALFDPLQPPGAIIIDEGREHINTWRPVPIESTPGDVAPFLTHLSTLVDDWRVLLNYLKFMVQRKGEKAMWWPFLQGVPGNGKSFISDTIEYCIGTTYTQRPTPKNIDSQFNATLYGCIFLAIEDIKVADDYSAFWETLKPMVTQRRLEIEYKGVDKLTRPVCFNAIMNSNHKNGIRKEPDDRRIAPFFARQQKKSDLERDGLTEAYFDKLWAWAADGGWAHVLHYLTHDPIEASFSATKCPITSSTEEHIRASRSPAEQEILEAVRCGVIGFKGGWINLLRANMLLDSKRYRLSIAARRAMIEGLGYGPHPGLPGGQLLTALADGTLPTLYVTGDHTSLGVNDPVRVKAMYEAANR